MTRGTVTVPPRPDLVRGPALPRPPARRRPIAILVVVALLGSLVGGVVVLGAQVPRREGSFAFIGEAAGAPIRWNPCEPVHYQVNMSNAPEDALELVREAFDRTSRITGIEFSFDGTTTRTIREQEREYYLSHLTAPVVWLPVLVVWLPRDEFRERFERPGMERHALAVARPIRGELETADQYTSGSIAIDAGAHLSEDFDGRYSLGMVLMHEAGHLMGLGHVNDPAEVMFSDPSRYPYPVDDWGPGDVEGLEILGRGGCLDRVPVSA